MLGVCLAGVFGFVPLLAGASAAAAFFAAMLGGGYLLLPAALMWTVAAPAHAALAGERRGTALLSEITRAARLDATKAAVVVLSRAAVMVLAFFNLHLLVRLGLWAAMNLGGFDVALASAELSLADPVYDIGLAMLCWLLLAPYFEASSFLLYLDARTRQEGLDLLQRVRRVFPTGRTGTAGRDTEEGVGVRDTRDPAWPLARACARRWPDRFRVVLQRGAPGLNPKVNQLISLAREARHEIVVVSDPRMFSNALVAQAYNSVLAAHLIAPQCQPVAPRDVVSGEVSLAVAVKLRQQFRRAAHLADAQPAVAVGVQHVEQAAALVRKGQRHLPKPGWCVTPTIS